MKSHKNIPPYIQRGLLALVFLLMAISVARLLTRVHQLEERVEQLEESTEYLHTLMGRQANATHSNDADSDVHMTYDRSSYTTDRHRHDKPYGKPANRQEAIPDNSIQQDTSSSAIDVPQRNTRPESPRSNKYTEPRRFNINHIDSATLVRIPGIAAKTASTILRYRQQYGGFYDPWQLQDFLTWEAAQTYMQDWCTLWFTADVSDVKLLLVNKATVAELRRHPYITYEQATEIVRYRTRHKRIEKVEEFGNFSTFKPEDIKRLAFYLSFE